ncbi:energy transducer TonB [Polyangium fumosum]|uniref:TonB C-terminal domain-containing protein n=1 Tax=Polyangium fumosum TaxID=889272 RepID=A0A4U1JGU7_9BACT|nr:energy transducer TonB [Polyangium fumosum]TKD11785.1 hypothetical protein E8A74_06515 [Polyangium fumosum]
MDEGPLRVGWLLAAAAAHGALFGAGYLHDEGRAKARELREAIQAQLDPFEVPVEAPPPAEKPAPEPPEELPPTPRPMAMQSPRPPQKDSADHPPKEAPEEPEPVPMAAPPVLVQQGLPDLSAVTFVSGIGEGTGLVSRFGAGLRAARRSSRGGGAPSPPSPPQTPDRSRPASLHGDRAWDCDFPSEAEAAGIRNVVVELRILVRADGRAQRVEVVSDPGHGFGAQARFCAAQHHYRPALDRDGQPIQASLGPIRIRFMR